MSRLHWLSVLTDLQNRGVQDILIACVDGLKGFPEAISSIFPKTEVQTCIVHQIRNSLKYVGSRHQKDFMKDLKLVYQSATEEMALKTWMLSLAKNGARNTLLSSTHGRITGQRFRTTSNMSSQSEESSTQQTSWKISIGK